jgi:hypothetical protein
MYSMIRRTLASNSSRLMFDLNRGAATGGRSGGGGTGPFRRSRISSMAATAAP